MSTVHLIVPAEIDDPRRPSGGNHYDRRVAVELARLGWPVVEHSINRNDSPAAAVAQLPDQAWVLVDGLIGSRHPEVLVPAARRLRLFVLLHQAQNTTAERAGLTAAAGVIATSDWTRRWLLEQYRLRPERIEVAEPGVDPAPLAIGSSGGARLLCVAAVAAHKGQDVLAKALAGLIELPWHCMCVGSLDRDPDFVGRLRRQVSATGLADRMTLVGPRTGESLAGDYARADAFVLPSLAETYGMVVTEALARGVPVIASDVGGVPEALGMTAEARRPGLLVPAADPAALRTALRRWLTDVDVRAGLRRAARLRRAELPSWARTAERIAQTLAAGTLAEDPPAAGEPLGTGVRMHVRDARSRTDADCCHG